MQAAIATAITLLVAYQVLIITAGFVAGACGVFGFFCIITEFPDVLTGVILMVMGGVLASVTRVALRVLPIESLEKRVRDARAVRGSTLTSVA
jgi:hypothetical protein